MILLKNIETFYLCPVRCLNHSLDLECPQYGKKRDSPKETPLVATTVTERLLNSMPLQDVALRPYLWH